MGQLKQKGQIMAKSQSNRYLQDLLNLFNNPIHRRQQQTRVCRPSGDRIIQGATDETGIGANNETGNNMVNDIYIHDCGHTSRDNLGGECHYCDQLICTDCISICSVCGHAICPQHTTLKDFDGHQKPYCHDCADEISRKLKLRSAGKKIGSFFVGKRKSA